jgi:hypothetical protein
LYFHSLKYATITYLKKIGVKEEAVSKIYAVEQDQKDIFNDIASSASKHQADFINNVKDVINPTTFNYQYLHGLNFEDKVKWKDFYDI